MTMDTAMFDHVLSDNDIATMRRIADQACETARDEIVEKETTSSVESEESGECCKEGADAVVRRLREALFGEGSRGVLVLRNVLGERACNDSETDNDEARVAAHRLRLTHLSSCLASMLGEEVLPQSADLGETIGFVEQHNTEVDEALVLRKENETDPTPKQRVEGWHSKVGVQRLAYRGYRNKKAQKLHTDSMAHNCYVDAVMFACISQAASGGASKVCAASDVISRLSPTSIETLSKPIPYICKDEWVPAWGESARGAAPLIVNDEYSRKMLQLGSNAGRKNIEYALTVNEPAQSEHQLGHGVSDKGSAQAGENHSNKAFAENFPSQVRAALDDIERVANDENVFHRLMLQSGDLLVLDNRRYLHARDSFEDCEGQRRLLLRYWIRTRSREDINNLFTS